MIDWLRGVFRGKDGPLEGAHLGLMCHREGIVVQPYYRDLPKRGPISIKGMGPEAWAFVPPDADPADLGRSILQGMARVQSRRSWTDDLSDTSGYNASLRKFLGLRKRTAL